jgi:hypothetical protein
MKLAVPREFAGLARGLRRNVDVADGVWMQEIKQLTTPLLKRLKRKPTLRNDAAIDLARNWSEIPNPFRLMMNADTDGKHIQIAECGIGISQGKRELWETFENTRCIKIVSLDTRLRMEMVSTYSLATISLHAIARWYQRTRSRDTTKLLHDLKQIIGCDDPEKVVLEDGSEWRGIITPAIDGHERQVIVRTVRTYLSHEQIDGRARIPPRIAALPREMELA